MQKVEAIKLPGKKMLSATIRSDEDKARFNAILEDKHYWVPACPPGTPPNGTIGMARLAGRQRRSLRRATGPVLPCRSP